MERKGIDLGKLKEALDKGEVFEEDGKLSDILKKSEDMTKSGKLNEIQTKRTERLQKQWEENKDDIVADVEKDSKERMAKREVNEKNEMVNAKIQFLENEIKVYEELGENIQHELDMNQQKIDGLVAQIKVLKEDIEE
jgi:hypothetical protein